MEELLSARFTPHTLLALSALGLMLIAGILIDITLLVLIITKGLHRCRNQAAVVRQRPWSWSTGGPILAAVAMLSTSLLVVTSILGPFLDLSTDTSLLITLALQTALVYTPIALAIASSLRRRNVSLATAFGSPRSGTCISIGLGVLFYLGALPLVGISDTIYKALLSAVGYSTQPQYMVEMFTAPGHSMLLRCVVASTAVLLAPLGEELLFRGIALPVLARHTSILAAMCIVSAIFAAVHFHVPSLVPLFVIAMCFSAAYVFSGSIVTPITMHVLFNGMSLAAAILLKNIQELVSH